MLMAGGVDGTRSGGRRGLCQSSSEVTLKKPSPLRPQFPWRHPDRYKPRLPGRWRQSLNRYLTLSMSDQWLVSEISVKPVIPGTTC